MKPGEQRSERVRVLHAITMLELGGAQENTLHTVRHLNRARYDVALATGPGGLLDDEARAIPDLERFFIPALARAVRPANDFRALAGLLRVLRSARPHIVHTHSSKAGILGRLAARLAGVPIVVHGVHGFGFTPGQRPPVRALFVAAERLTARITSHFVAVSRANITEGVRRGIFRRDQVSLIRSGIPIAPFRDAPDARAAVRRELGLDPDAPLVGMVSCLKPQKDPLTFAEVAARVHATHPTAHFCLAGDGDLRPVLEARIAELGIASAVHLLGWRRDIPRLMSAFDVLLHTSRWEGLPRVLPQAMAAGLAVVATAVDGAPEAIRDGQNGFLAEPRDVPTLAGAVSRLIGDPDLSRRMGARGQELAEEFDMERLVPAQEALYERLLSVAPLLVGAQAAA